MPANRVLMDISGIYQLVCKTTNKRYIGSAENLYRRCRHHFTNLRKGQHTNRFLQRAFTKYGEEDFVFLVLEFCAKNNLIKQEQKWLDVLYDDQKMCFNILPNARSSLGSKMSATARRNMSIAKSGQNHPNFGKGRSEETKRKIGNAHRGKKLDEATRKKIGEAGRGRKHTLEAKQKMSRARMGNKHSLGHQHSQEYKDKMSLAITEWWRLRKEKKYAGK